jgi:rhodanese-related sulfurtransferase
VRFALAVFLSFASFLANAAFSGAIVDASAVAKAIARGAIVWDVRQAEKFFDGHIPGAVNVGDVEEARRVAFFAVGVQNASMQRLSQIVVRPPVKLSGLNFQEMFVWLSTSMQRVSRSHTRQP